MTRSAPILLACSALLAACGEEPADDPTAFEEGVGDLRRDVVPIGEEAAGPQLELGPDFATLQLGERLGGEEASETTDTFVGPAGQAGTIRSYVACEPGVPVCDPAQLGPDGIYTYVVEVVPSKRTSVFRTAQPVGGFTGTTGFDQAAASAALPGDSRLAVRCVNGALVWAISGGGGWSGEPITFYWQSTSPPERTADAFQLIAEGERASASGLFPAAGSTDACP